MLSSVIMLTILFGLVFGVSILFLPTGVAMIRNHPNTLAIFLINLFLGWTFLGWVASLVWACSTPAPRLMHTPGSPASRFDPSRIPPSFRGHTSTALSAGAPYRGSR